MMDIFCEYLVQKKSASDTIKGLLLKAACGLVLAMSLYFCFFMYTEFLGLVPIIWGVAIYATVILGRNFSIEYEYIFTNGQLDIDMIKGKAKRQNLTSIACKNIEYMAPYSSLNDTHRTVIDAIYDENRRGKYYVDFSQDGESFRLLFQPPEKILTNMKKYNPRNINL